MLKTAARTALFLAFGWVGMFAVPTLQITYAQPEARPVVQTAVTLYEVVFVTPDDVLNVRSGAGVANRIIGTLPPDAQGIEITGAAYSVGSSLWVPIRHGSLVGWVNRYFLTEQVDSQTFCSDPQVLTLIADVQQAVSTRDSELLAALVSPVHGLNIRYHPWNDEVRFSWRRLQTFFTDQRVYDWGSFDGSGFDMRLTLSERIIPELDRVLLAPEQMECNELLLAGGGGQIASGYEQMNFYSLHLPGAPGHEFEWGTWAMGIEYFEGAPRLNYLVYYTWTI